MAWIKETNNALAYIDNETLQASKENDFVKELAESTLKKAERVMLTLKNTDIDINNSMKVRVEPAMKYNKENKTEEPLLHLDGSPVYKASAELSNKKTTLTLIAPENPTKENFAAMSCHKWDMTSGSPVFKFYKQEDIQTAPINKEIKELAKLIEDENLIKGSYQKTSPLKTFAIEANKFFNSSSEKIINNNSEFVNNAYAKFIEDDKFGDKVFISNHTDNVVIELGITSQKNNYALAINYDLNPDFEPRYQGELPAKAYINKMEDVLKFIDLPEIQQQVIKYKNFEIEKTEKVKQRQHER